MRTGMLGCEQHLEHPVAAGVDKVDMIHRLDRGNRKDSPDRDFKFRFMDEVIDQNYHCGSCVSPVRFLFLIAIVLQHDRRVRTDLYLKSEYRRKEIGIRKIMGSSNGEILLLCLPSVISSLVVCFVLAVPFGWWIGHDWLESFSDKTPIRAWVFVDLLPLVSLITVLTVTFQCWKNANETLYGVLRRNKHIKL